MPLADAVPFSVAAWTLDEAFTGSAVTREDSVGASDLADVNTVGSAAFKFSNGADFESGSSERLHIADNEALSMGDITFFLRAWVRLESKAANMVVFGKWDFNAGQREYFVQYNAGSDRFEMGVSQTGGGTDGSVVANNFGSPSTGTDYLIHAWHNHTADNINIAVNAGTANTAAYSVGVHQGTSPFFLGCLGGTSDGSETSFMDGLIDDAVILKGYILDATERTADYNGGTGVAFADWTGGGGNRRRRLILGA